MPWMFTRAMGRVGLAGGKLPVQLTGNVEQCDDRRSSSQEMATLRIRLGYLIRERKIQ